MLDSVHKPSLTSRQFIEVPVPSQESRQSCASSIDFYDCSIEFENCTDGVVFLLFILLLLQHLPDNTHKETQVCT